MKINEIIVAFPLGPYFSRYSYIFYFFLNDRLKNIKNTIISFPYLGREYLSFLLVSKEDALEEKLRKIFPAKFNKSYINITEIQEKIKIEKKNPYNYINDLFYSTFFLCPYCCEIYKEFENLDIKEIEKEYKIGIENMCIYKKSNSKKIFIPNMKKDNIILKRKGIINIKSPFPSGYSQVGFLIPQGNNNLINAHLISSYFELLLRRELMYKREDVYYCASEVVPHFGGIIIKIIVSGFKLGNKKMINRLLNVLKLKDEIKLEWIKNRALAKIYVNLEYFPLRNTEYLNSFIFHYDIDNIIKGIKEKKKLKVPNINDIFGIILL